MVSDGLEDASWLNEREEGIGKFVEVAVDTQDGLEALEEVLHVVTLAIPAVVMGGWLLQSRGRNRP